MIKKYFNLIFYYLLVFLGLIITSWIIWSRFIRKRIIRNIPDSLFTEYRFWILLYICFIYSFTIKNLIKPSETTPYHEIIIFFTNIIYKPLITLDHLIKYNTFIKPYYYRIMFTLSIFIKKKPFNLIKILVFFSQLFPRIILISFLIIDTFYFNKLEIFYKIILIGIIPFIYRYFKYSIKDLFEHLIVKLENKYSRVKVYEKGYEFDKNRKNNTNAALHCEERTIREYIEIKFDNYFDYLNDDVNYEYEAFPFIKNEIHEKYKNLYNRRINITELDKETELYYELMPKIITLKLNLYRFETIDEQKLIIRSKIIIFGGYLICWAYILIISYYYYPVELIMGKYLLKNFMIYLMRKENPFYEIDEVLGSNNKNLITIENVKKILYKIILHILK